jgi:hypothetical protein
MSYVLVGSAGATIISGFIGASDAKSRGRAALDERNAREAELRSLENSRQAIINPYAGIKDISGLAKNLSGMISNPYANLGVATQAAKMQAEEQDISLANTLDTLKATGASAGGATALAQAALQGKKGIAASIEQQEANNEKLRAQGEADVQRLKMAEEQRIQNVQMSEAQRVQEAEAQGKAFEFNARETREVAKMNRVAGLMDNAAAQQAQANADYTGAITGTLSGLSSIAGSYFKAQAGKKGKTTPTQNQTSADQDQTGADQEDVDYTDMGIEDTSANTSQNYNINLGFPTLGGAGTRYL